MDPRFSPHNTHLENPARFVELDPNLPRLRDLPLIYRSPLPFALARLWLESHDRS